MARLQGLLALCLLLLHASAAFAEEGYGPTPPPASRPATLVRDIVPGQPGSGPRELTDVEGTLFFTANDREPGGEVWRSNGTLRGTTVFRGGLEGDVYGLRHADGTLFFATSRIGPPGAEIFIQTLWASDGTPEGTRSLLTQSPRIDPFSLVVIGRTLFFNGARGDTSPDHALWRSDGTPEGTVRVKDVQAFSLTAVGGTLFFTSGATLWKSDGTTAGTVQLSGFGEASRVSLENLTAVAGLLFFTVTTRDSDGTPHVELWRSNGTPEGTVRVRALPGTAVASPTAVGAVLYFVTDEASTGRELWRSDGTDAGTRLVRDILPGPGAGPGPSSLTALNGTLFFNAEDGRHGRELWKSEGTSASTILVKDLQPGPGSSMPPGARTMEAVGGRLLLAANDGRTGYELWTSDGTGAGTRQLQDIAPGAFSSSPHGFTVSGSRVFFVANDGCTGFELWTLPLSALGARAAALPSNVGLAFTGMMLALGLAMARRRAASGPALLVLPLLLLLANGCAQVPAEPPDTDESPADSEQVEQAHTSRSCGTGCDPVRLVQDIAYAGLGSDPQELTRVRGKLLFSADDQLVGRELWRSNGSAEDTFLVKDIRPGPEGSHPTLLTEADERLYFSADDGTHGRELWRSNGSARGTILVTDIAPGAGGSEPRELFAIEDSLYFSADDGTHGRELWRSKGTVRGTTLVADLAPGAGSSEPRLLARRGRTLFFVANDGTLEGQLWKTEGSATSTIRITSFPTGPDFSGITSLAVSGGTVYFTPGVGGFPRQLWRSDGTPKGTVPVPGAPEGAISHLTDVDGTLFFVANRELWKTDGTAAGTVRIFAFNPDAPFPSDVTDTLATNGLLFFATAFTDERLFPTIWRSDGTPEGTFPLFPLFVDELSGLTAVDGKVLFAAGTFDDGIELWMTDGTVEGTFQVRDLAPGNISSRPAFFVQDKGSVLFSADDGAGGRELWRARLSQLRDCTPPRIFCGDFVPVTASGQEGAVVDHLPVSARDTGPEPTLRYSQPPGSLFPIGTTPVTVTATDVGGNSVSCTLEVTVLPPEAPAR